MDTLVHASYLGPLLFAVALLAAAPGLYAVMRASGVEERLRERLTGSAHADKALEAPASRLAPVAQKVMKVAERAAPRDEDQLSDIRFRLIRAGYVSKNAVAVFFAARLLGLVIPQFGLLFALPWIEAQAYPAWFPFALSGFLAIGGLALPGIHLDKRIEKKSQQCSDGFPDMMDLLVACVEAGLSLDAAVLRVSEELASRHGELSLQLKTLALEMRAGRSRKAAWRSFADRIGLEEAGSLATMLRQAEEMGTSLGDTLRIFSKSMRQRRMLMAEEKAMALPAKMTVPLILFVFPVLLGILIVPAVIRFQSFM